VTTIKEAATEFLNHKRIAVTGVSRTPGKHGSNVVYKRLRDPRMQHEQDPLQRLPGPPTESRAPERTGEPWDDCRALSQCAARGSRLTAGRVMP
jgi:hypothetical protein